MKVRQTTWAASAAILLASTALSGASPASAGPVASTQVTVGTASMTLSPTSIRASKNSTFPIQVKVNTNGRPVNAVQITLSFPDARLDCASVAPGSVWSGVAVQTCDSSKASIVVYNFPPAFTGTAVAATVNLRTTAVTGKAVISLPLATNLVVTSDTNTNILGTTNKATVTVS